MPLSIGGVDLPDDLIWTDEYQWSAVTQKMEITVGGALLIEESVQAAGRLITLEGDESSAWATRTQIEALRTLAEQPNEVHELVLPDGREFDVMFRRPAFEAKPIIPFNVSAAGDFYSLRVFLIEV